MSPAEQDVGVMGVDDHVIFLDVAREVVTATHGFRWVGGVTSGQAALDAVSELRPDLILLDMRMPGMDGFEAAHRITIAHPDVLVILVSIDEVVPIESAVEKSGAAALVPKQQFGPKLLRGLWERYGATPAQPARGSSRGPTYPGPPRI